MILIMWPIRGHRGFPEELGRTGDYRVDERRLKMVPFAPCLPFPPSYLAIIAGGILRRTPLLIDSQAKTIAVALPKFYVAKNLVSNLIFT